MTVDTQNSWIAYEDPDFASLGGGNYLNGDYHLQGSSPCIDKGLNPDQTGYAQALSADRDGNARPVDMSGVTNYGPSAYADPGAYERQQ